MSPPSTPDTDADAPPVPELEIALPGVRVRAWHVSAVTALAILGGVAGLYCLLRDAGLLVAFATAGGATTAAAFIHGALRASLGR